MACILCMRTPNEKLTRNAYNWIFSLSRKQTAMLKDKDVALAELYDLCDNDIQRNLIKDLIVRFHCFDEEIYNLALMQIVEHISKLGLQFNINLCSFCFLKAEFSYLFHQFHFSHRIQ